jgi:penicillin-binding protein 1A
MNVILVKIFATALALSQVMTRPDAVKTQFNPAQDQVEVINLLQAGCAHMRKVFAIEDINLDDLITTAMDDPQVMSGGIKALHGLKFDELFTAYRQFCKNETVEHSPVDIGDIIAFYDKAAADLPDHTKLKDLKLPGLTVVLDGKGSRFAELGQPDHRRIWVPLIDIPAVIQLAFVAAEDKRFFQHTGIDERGIIRAFVGNLAQPGRPQGGSTITQQVVKNLLVGDDITYERKIREIIVAARLERTFSKLEILALYLNSIYLGRGSWGVEMAAHSYFGKSVKELTLPESALLAGLTKGPNYLNPDRHPDRAGERIAYVLTRMHEDGVISADRMQQPLGQVPQLVAYDPLRRDSGFYFVDYLAREAKVAGGIDALTTGSYTVHSTVRTELQRATESALQEGLARYELRTGRLRFEGPQANLSDAVQRIQSARNSTAADTIGPVPSQAPQSLLGLMPPWRQALATARPPLYDVQWPTAVVVTVPTDKNAAIRVGLRDGRTLPLTTGNAAVGRTLKLYDLVFVQVVEGKAKSDARAELRVPPSVQGAALVLENKSGRVLAMAGGFSYPLSQLNRTTQMKRQPGSALKPITYLAALEAGLQPNTLVLDEPITLPPIGYVSNPRKRDYWSPKNYDRGSSGIVTLRQALENSMNRATARLLASGIASSPEDGLDRVCAIAVEAQLYKECTRYYPFVLGAQPLRMLDLAAFYAGIANGGMRPSPYAIDSIEQNGRLVHLRSAARPAPIEPIDHAAFYQLKAMLQGVVQRGTARSIRHLAPYVAGKTGTTENENDAWFVGFTNDVTVVVWVGYDNANGQRRTLGDGETGAQVAIPIFQSIIQAVWASYAPPTVLSPPSSEARRQLADLPIDLLTGDLMPQATEATFLEHFHLDGRGQLHDTQYRLVPRENALAYRERNVASEDESSRGWSHDDDGRSVPNSPFGQIPSWSTPPLQPQQRELSGWRHEEERPRPRRIDPDYPWAPHGLY